MSIRKGSRTIASSVPVTEWGSVDGTLTDQADLKNALDSKAEKYSPTFTGTPLAPTAPVGTSNNQIATTKYVQDALLNAGSDLPDQTGQSGKFLTTNGTLPSWVGISQVPSQSGQSGKFLTTNGTTASWNNITGFVKTTTDESIDGIKTFIGGKSTNEGGEIHIASVDNNSNFKYGVIDVQGSASDESAHCIRLRMKDNEGLMVYSNGTAKLKTAPGSSSSTDNIYIPTVGWVNDPTKSTNVVHRSGDETIAGSKTFTSRMWTTVDDTNPIAIKDTVLGVWETPSTDRHRYIGILDKGNNLISYIHAYKNISGVQHIYLQTTNSDNSSTIYSEKIGLKISNAGVVTTYAPTPPASDNSTQIATTEWVSTNIKLNAGTNIEIDNNKNINYTGPRYFRLATRTWTYAQWTQYCERGVTTNISPSFTVSGIRAGDLVTVEGICSDRGNANVLAWGIAQGEAAADTGNVSVTFLGLNIQEDSSIVHLTGDETIAGTKTFSTTPLVGTVSSTSDNSTKAASTEFVINVLKAIYPVGSLYMGTQNSCPLSAFFGTWTLVSAGSALWTGNGTSGSGTTANANYANAAANTTIAAGLPNITGSVTNLSAGRSVTPAGSGALSVSKTGSWSKSGTDSPLDIDTISLNASNSNSIYGTSSTVQPPAYVVNVWRRTA